MKSYDFFTPSSLGISVTTYKKSQSLCDKCGKNHVALSFYLARSWGGDNWHNIGKSWCSQGLRVCHPCFVNLLAGLGKKMLQAIEEVPREKVRNVIAEKKRLEDLRLLTKQREQTRVYVARKKQELKEDLNPFNINL